MGSDEENSKNGSSDTTKPGSSASAAANGPGSKAGWILLGAAAILAAGAVGVNVWGGSSEEPQTELSGNELPTIEDLREAAEASSDDARPWSELAFAHYERGEFAESAQAYERAVAIDGSEAVLWSALGEARVYASERDPLPPEALEAFEKALELDPGDPRARYFMAVKQDLADDHEGAISSWLALLADTPAGAPWEGDLVRTIQQVGAIHDIDVETRLATVMQGRTPQVALPGSGDIAGDAASSSVRGPTAQQVAEASRMTPGEQQTMIAGMVEGLEARLQNEPDDLDGWVMLMRSRMNLGEPDKAREALDAAIAANPGEAAELRRMAAQLGIQ